MVFVAAGRKGMLLVWFDLGALALDKQCCSIHSFRSGAAECRRTVTSALVVWLAAPCSQKAPCLPTLGLCAAARTAGLQGGQTNRREPMAFYLGI